jgi:glyoxylase-like metal-dependent hydrolase (beta-lactamase superfamily II)
MELIMLVTRRHLVGALVAAPAILKSGSLAFAKAPLAGKAAPAIYRFKVGTMEVTAISDGGLAIPSTMFTGDKAEMSKALMGAGAQDPTPTPILTYLVNTGDKLVLVDTGYREVGGPTAGRMMQNLLAAGVKPEDVDVVALTHAHADHINGAVTPDGKPVFPNAEMVVAEVEAKFWRDDTIMAGVPADFKVFFTLARAGFAPYAAKTRFIGAKADIVPGITAEAAPGHTVGHTMYRLSSGNAQLLLFGDIVHNASLQFAHPEWSIAFDTDPAMAATTRKRVFDMITADKLDFAGVHIPFPGIGTAVKDGTAYRYVPATWKVDL